MNTEPTQRGWTHDEFQAHARRIVFNYAKKRLDTTDKHVTFELDEVYVVWFAKVLQNWKALVSTALPDGMYYEVTYDGDKKKAYLDAYKKFDNVAVLIEDLYPQLKLGRIMVLPNSQRQHAGLKGLSKESDPYSDEAVKAFKKRIAELKDMVIVQAGKLEFAEADAKIRLAQIQAQQAENRAIASEVRRLDTELSIFVLENEKEGL